MKDYKIIINVSEVGGVYSTNSLEEAEKIAESLCNEIYTRLKEKCRVEVESVTEVNN